MGQQVVAQVEPWHKARTFSGWFRPVHDCRPVQRTLVRQSLARVDTGESRHQPALRKKDYFAICDTLCGDTSIYWFEIISEKFDVSI